MAGLKGLLPKPPYRCFAKIIAKLTATTVTHQGARGGKAIPNKTAVNNALLSFKKKLIGRLRIFKIRASHTTAVRLASAILINVPQPKK